MAKVVLHIGLPKTGSTAIQGWLRANEAPLRSAGLNYPSFLRASNHLELAVYAADASDESTRRLLALEDEPAHRGFRSTFAQAFSAATAHGDWIFSSEHLSSRLRSTKEIGRLRELLSRFESVLVVVYVRPQDEMAAASHSTWVKDGDHRGFDIDRHLGFDDRYDFRRIVERWDVVFGADFVDVRLYPSDGLVNDFMSSIGLDPKSSWTFSRSKDNPSLDSKEIAFVREMNRRLPRWTDGPDHRYLDLSHAIAGSGRGSSLRLSSAERRRLLQHFEDVNDWIMRRASNADRFPDYFNRHRDHPAAGTIEEELTLDDALEFARALWARASAAEKKLHRLSRRE